MKIVLNYDAVTGEVTDNSGSFITSWMGLSDHELIEGADTETIIQLKKAGFTADNIIDLRRKEII